MSSGLECLFVQKSTQEWFCVLERPFNENGNLDWRDTAQAYGPFLTEEATDEHLRDNHSNPGSSNSEPLPDGATEIVFENNNHVMKRLFAEDENPAREQQRYRYPRF